LFSIFVFYAPNVLRHPNNFIRANPMSTPTHIVQEWYFLPIYAILRNKSNKSRGVIYEPKLLKVSHGFRLDHLCYTALKQIKQEWRGTP
jgi:quinol-cytochrome oxidoreductase complex cytochrome b subunit